MAKGNFIRRAKGRIANLLILVLPLGSLVAAPAEAAGVRLPECAALEGWVAEVDPADRWAPVKDSRAWMPRAFGAPTFEKLFGSPALDWERKDADAVAQRLFECGGEAGDAGRRDARKALYEARRWFKNNLIGVLVARARADAAVRRAERRAAQAEKVEESRRERAAEETRRRNERQKAEAEQDAQLERAMEAVLSQPDSLGLLETLVEIAGINPRNPMAVNSAVVRYGPQVGQLLAYARRQGLAMDDPPIGEALQARIAGLRGAVAGEYRARIDALPNDAQALRLLESWRGEIKGRAKVLGEETSAALLGTMSERRKAIEEAMLAGFRSRVAEAAAGEDANDALKNIAQAVAESREAGLSSERQTELQSQAEGEEAALAAKALAEEEAELASVPETMKGLGALLNKLRKTRRGPLSRAPEAALTRYRQAVHVRLGEVAATALPDFEAALEQFPENPQGLRMTELTLVEDEEFESVPEESRERYRTALKSRREEIRAAMTRAAEAARRQAVSRGGDPDLVGQVFRDPDSGLSIGFVDEKRVTVSLNGKEDDAPYEATKGEVVVRGRGLTLHLTRKGSGPGTELEWLGRKLHRVER